MSDHAGIEQASSAVLETDAPCGECGYNLRGLPVDSICPECAHPIAESLKVDLYPLGTGHDLRHLWWGLLAAGIAYVIWLVAMGGYGIIFAGFERVTFLLVGAAGPTPWISALLTVERPPRAADLWNIVKVAMTLAQLAWVAGIWLATINERIRPRRRMWVILLRFALVTGVVLPYVIVFNRHRFNMFPVFPIACVQLNFAAVAGTALWLGRIAHVDRARWLKWTCIVLAVASLAAQVLVALAYRRSGAFPFIYAFAAIAAVGLAQFIVVLLLLWRVHRYKRTGIS